MRQMSLFAHRPGFPASLSSEISRSRLLLGRLTGIGVLHLSLQKEMLAHAYQTLLFRSFDRLTQTLRQHLPFTRKNGIVDVLAWNAIVYRSRFDSVYSHNLEILRKLAPRASRSRHEHASRICGRKTKHCNDGFTEKQSAITNGHNRPGVSVILLGDPSRKLVESVADLCNATSLRVLDKLIVAYSRLPRLGRRDQTVVIGSDIAICARILPWQRYNEIVILLPWLSGIDASEATCPRARLSYCSPLNLHEGQRRFRNKIGTINLLSAFL